MNDLTDLLVEQHHVAGLLLGAVSMRDWRPTLYWPHVAIVDAIEVVRLSRAHDRYFGVGPVLDVLRDRDPSWPWATHARMMLEAWDRVETAVAGRRAAKRQLIALGERVLVAHRDLEDRVTDLLAARKAAEAALVTRDRLLVAFETNARSYGVPAPETARAA